jgi:hypothetical protein
MRDVNLFFSLPPPKPPYVVAAEEDPDKFRENMKDNPDIIDKA